MSLRIGRRLLNDPQFIASVDREYAERVAQLDAQRKAPPYRRPRFKPLRRVIAHTGNW